MSAVNLALIQQREAEELRQKRDPKVTACQETCSEVPQDWTPLQHPDIHGLPGLFRRCVVTIPVLLHPHVLWVCLLCQVQFSGDLVDATPKNIEVRTWCHLLDKVLTSHT